MFRIISGLRLGFLAILYLICTFSAKEAIGQAQDNDIIDADYWYVKADSLFNVSSYDSSILYFTKASQLYIEHDDAHGYFNTQINIANIHRILGNYGQSENILKKVFLKHEDLLGSNKMLAADYYHVLGTLYFNQGDLERAIQKLERSVEMRVESGFENDSSLALTYNNIGTTYLYLGDNSRALSFYERALNIALDDDAAREDPEIAMYYMNIGIVYARSGDFDKAAEYFRKNLEINEKILNPLDLDLALIYNNLGRLNYLLSKRDEAIKYHNLAENLIKKKFGTNYYALGEIYVNKGNIYSDMNDFDKALDYFKKSLQIYKSGEKKNNQRIAPIYNNIGTVYLKKEQFNESIEYYELSYELTNDPISQTLLLRNLARSYLNLGDIGKSENFILKSIEVAKNKLSKNHYEIGNSYLIYGEFLLSRDRLDEALEYFYKAEDIMVHNFSLKNPHLSKVYSHIAEYYEKIGEYKTSLEYYQKGLIANIYGYEDTSIYSYPEIDSVIFVNELLPAMLGKADVFTKFYNQTGELKDLKSGLNAYALAIRIVDDIRSGLTEQSKLNYVSNVRDIYQNSIETCVDLYLLTSEQSYLEDAFQYSEKSRSAVLLSSIRDVEAMEIGGIPDSLREREKFIRERINAYEKLMYDERSKISMNEDKIDLWEAKLFELNRNYDELIQNFEDNFPAYYRLKYDSEVLNIKNLQTSLSDEQAVLEYSRLDSSIIIFLVRNDLFKVVSVNIDSSFNERVSFLIDYYQSSLFRHSPEVYDKFVSASHYLYNLLINPVQDFIGNRQLTVIPDGNLNYIPFETLITEIPVTDLMDYRGLPYLIKNNPLSYSFSATILYEYINEKYDNTKLLAFVPRYSKADQIINKTGYPPEAEINLLDPLDNARKEVESISKIVRGKSFFAEDATETNFRKQASEFGILHLAMHTVIDDVDPMYSRLIFTQNTQDTLNDGFLYAYELYNMDLNANLAVLSACNTGFGKLKKGEGVISLARGFTYSGVPSVVMTLWEVEDKSGADIMTSFYRNIENGMDMDVALQKAKLTYLSSASQFRSHPYFWSAYVTIGDTDPVMNKWPGIQQIVLFGILALIVVAIAVFLYRKNRFRKS